MELTVRAALEESRDHVYPAALLDPNTAATLTTAEIVAMCDDLFEAHKAPLPAAFALPGSSRWPGSNAVSQYRTSCGPGGQ